MRKLIMFAVVAVMLLCSCGKQEPEYVFGIPISPENEVISDLVTTIYSDEELHAIIEFDGTITDFDDTYKIECIREVFDGYRVSYLGSSSVAIVHFDYEGSKCSKGIYELHNEKKDFQKLKKGSSLYDVLEIDPDAMYPIIELGRTDIRESWHLTTDGYTIRIIYAENEDIIGEINIEPI